ncbi:MAG: tetratricopeptide repeat protein [Bacilli bacterium]
MRYASAQKICQTLADLYPRGKYRYEAMSDAAHYSRMIGVDASYKAALSILDKLCSEYPEDPRNFYARMSQAEILRLINAFAEARSLYNEIINKFPDHPQIYIAWLGLGDSILAQPKRAADAAVIFERLFYLPEMPLDAKSEAAFNEFAKGLEGNARQTKTRRSKFFRTKRESRKPRAVDCRSLLRWQSRSNQKAKCATQGSLIVKNKLPSWQTASAN